VPQRAVEAELAQEQAAGVLEAALERGAVLPPVDLYSAEQIGRVRVYS
jgi:hypothetical protein